MKVCDCFSVEQMRKTDHSLIIHPVLEIMLSHGMYLSIMAFCEDTSIGLHLAGGNLTK